MADQKSLVPSDCTSDGGSRTTARGRFGAIHNRTLLGLFHSTKRRLPRISRFSCSVASVGEHYGGIPTVFKRIVLRWIRACPSRFSQLRIHFPLPSGSPFSLTAN